MKIIFIAFVMGIVPAIASLVYAENPPRSNGAQTVVVEENGETTIKVTTGNKIRRINKLGFNAGDMIDVQTKNVDNEGNGGVTIINNTQHIVHQVYLDSNMPEVIPIYPNESSASFSVKNLVGDKDNFGFGGGTVPCAFFNNTGTEDVGVFDRELSGGDEVENWHHPKSSWQPAASFQDVFSTLSARERSRLIITLQIRETFSDSTTPTINISNVQTFPFDRTDCSSGCQCNFGTIHTFTLSAKKVLKPIINDALDVTFSENGDDVGLDYSEFTLSLGR